MPQQLLKFFSLMNFELDFLNRFNFDGSIKDFFFFRKKSKKVFVLVLTSRKFVINSCHLISPPINIHLRFLNVYWDQTVNVSTIE